MIAWLALAGALASVDVSSAALTSGEQRALAHVNWFNRGDGVHVLAAAPFGIPVLPPGGGPAPGATTYEKHGDAWEAK